MSVVVEKCQESDLESLGKVWSITYGNGEPYTRDPDKPRLSEDFVAKMDGVAVGGFGVSPMTATRGEAEFQCAGILAVAVMPHIRGGGVGKAMMRYAVQEYFDRGYELASLYPFKESFYRMFGYESAGVRYQISVEAAAFPRVNASLPILQLGAGCVDVIHHCYTKFAHQRSGLNLRHGNQWDRLLPQDSLRTVYVAGYPTEAYLIVQHKAEFWADQEIVEFVWTTQLGYESILSVMAGIGINKSKIVWTEPSDSPYRAKYWDRGASLTGLHPQIMYRVINVRKALAGLKPSASGKFTIEIADDVMPVNNGPWSVSFSPSGVKVEPFASDAGIKIDIRHFTQAFLGEPSLASLVGNGLVEVRDLAQVKEAEKLLTPSPTVCYEFF